MYMCSCRAVTDGQIRKEVENGCPTWKDLVHRTEVATQCGTCARDAKALFDDLKAKRDQALKEEKLKEEKLKEEKPLNAKGGCSCPCNSLCCPEKGTSSVS